MSDSSFSTIKSAAARKGKSKDEGLWLLSFSDLCCMLIAFFVLLLSYSKLDPTHYDNVQEGMKEEEQAKKQATPKEEATMKQLSSELTTAIKKLKLDEKTEVIFDVDGVAIEFKDPLLFRSGSAKGDPRFEPMTDSIIQLIATQTKTYKLTFEGHTDDMPMAGGPYANNWELSNARGLALMEKFKRRGVPEERMAIVSYAHTKPVVPYKGLKGQELTKARNANRRAVIRIHY